MSIINNLLSNILVEISRNSLDFSDKSANHKEVVEQAVNYINEYFLTEITPIQLAELTNYSYHHFAISSKNFRYAPATVHYPKKIRLCKTTIGDHQPFRNGNFLSVSILFYLSIYPVVSKGDRSHSRKI